MAKNSQPAAVGTARAACEIGSVVQEEKWEYFMGGVPTSLSFSLSVAVKVSQIACCEKSRKNLLFSLPPPAPLKRLVIPRGKEGAIMGV